MSSVLSLYFDGTIVQVLAVSVSRGLVSVGEAATFLQSELDGYLSACRAKTCVISYNPVAFAQTILHIPPTAGRHTDQLVGVDLKKYHPDTPSFIYFHRTIGETTSDARPFHKIAAYSYDDAPLADILSIVSRHNIVVSHIYASPYSIFRLVIAASEQAREITRLFIVSLPGEKLCLLSENGELAFVRKISSPEAELQKSDLHSIVMTVSYCLQSLRIKPMQIAMVNLSSPAQDLAQILTVPVETGFTLPIPGVSDEIIADYLAPLASAFHYLEAPRQGDLRPPYYRAFLRDKKAFTHGTTLMVLCALLLASIALTTQIVITDLKLQIATLRMALGNSGEKLKIYRALDDEANKLGQSIDLINKHNSSLDPALALASLPFKSSAEYVIKEIAVKKEGDVATVLIKGGLNASSFNATQAVFESMVERLAKTSGYTISASSVDVKQKTFTLEARYVNPVKPVGADAKVKGQQ